MLSREMDPGLGRSGRVKPQLECLEDRCCPTAVVLTPHLVLMDNASNVPMSLRDDGHGDVTVSFKGHTTTYHGVQSIEIDSTTSNDQISYTLTSTLKQSEQLTLNLGQGNDQVRLDFSKGIASPKAGVVPHVGIKVDGGGGDNQVSAIFGAITDSDLSVTANLGNGWDHFLGELKDNISGKSNVNVTVNGGRGVSGVNVAASGAIGANASLSVKVTDGRNDDTSSVDYAGKLSGHLSIQENAGAGWDWLESNINLAPGSNGWLMAHEIGGAGADLLLLLVRNGGSLKHLDALISGVNDSSAVDHTTNVKVTHH